MNTAAQLRQQLQEINRRSYPAYKGLAGVYQFATYQLSIDHVQGDPFAAPSALHIWIDHKTAGFPASLAVRSTGFVIRPRARERAA